ncbi:MAG: hypothetical protein AAGA64_13810 [Bacteroidota bacterium]
MSTHTEHSANHEIYFCTITCYKWLPLFEITNTYDAVYNWFNHLKKKDCQVLGFVIMPNHLHVLLYPTADSLNKLVANGKRFMAYAIVQRLEQDNRHALLKELAEGVQPSEKKKGKKHQVFRLSFDARLCFNEPMVEQKLQYIHHNPVQGKWNLVDDFVHYPYSSAGFYEGGRQGTYSVTHYKELNSIEHKE